MGAPSRIDGAELARSTVGYARSDDGIHFGARRQLIAPEHAWERFGCEDPRITRVGRFIRRTSIDELPQLINVLLGDMSLVGPRPDVPAQRSLYSDADWAMRCSVRPGITGLAQALYRSTSTEAQRLEADLRYAREHTLWLDARIVWWTLGRLGGQGAN